jgi:hypothetical protein
MLSRKRELSRLRLSITVTGGLESYSIRTFAPKSFFSWLMK